MPFRHNPPNASSSVHRLDYLGITLLISGSFVSCFYFMFYCNAKLQTFYLSFVFLFSLMTSAVCLFERFSDPQYRTIRAIMFLLFGCSGVVPVLHYIQMHTLAVFENQSLKLGEFADYANGLL